MFSVGDEVVCVDAKDATGCGSLNGKLRAGETYTVDGIYPCGRISMREIQTIVPSHWCCGCARTHYYKWRFVKLPKQSTETEREAQAPDLATVR